MINEHGKYKKWWLKAELSDVIIFDLDGTLIDSDFANFLSYKSAVEYVLAQKLDINFVPGVRITRAKLAEIVPGICNEKLAEIVACKELIYPRFLSKTIINMPLLSFLECFSYKELILATNGCRSRAEMLLDYYGISEEFDRKVCRDPLCSKDKYSRFLPEILKNKKSVVIFENDEKDIASAISCGMDVRQVINIRGLGNE